MKKTTLSLSLTTAIATILCGCADLIQDIPNVVQLGLDTAHEAKVNKEIREANGDNPNIAGDQKLLQDRIRIGQKFNNNTDTDAWYEQRQKIALATGDRVFDKDFGRVFDSLTLAASTMELKVNNMERQSGYISASGISLPPTESRAMRREAVNDWCRQNGFDPSILDRKFRTSEFQQAGEMADLTEMMAKYDKMQKGLTFQLMKMGDNQTKVKLRFSDVYYPAEVEAYYKLVWQAVDKQIFVDQNIEGAVEKRK